MSHRDTVAGYPLLLAVLVLLAGLARPAASQAAPAGWAVAAEAGIQAFSAIAARRAESATSLVPRAAMVTGASLARRYRGWELEAGVGLITTALAVEDAGLTVVARDASISRARLRLMASLTLIDHAVSTGEAELFERAVDSVVDDLRASDISSWVFGSWLVGLAFAIVLKTRIPFNTGFKVLLLLPWVVPVVVSATSWNWPARTGSSTNF